jgi:molybdopterin-guanine dinucleotide biosynthesis protein A
MASAAPPRVGVILAGGSSTRMGRDKLMLPIAGKPMLAHVLERIAPQVDRVVLSANGDPARFSAFGLPVVGDAIKGGLGPLTGLLAGMFWAKSNLPAAKLIASVAADTPFFPTNFVSQLSQCHDPATITLAASSGGTHSVFGLWPIELADDLETFLTTGENPKVLNFADRHGPKIVSFTDLTLPNGETVDPFFNVNTPEDAARADALAKALES